MQQNQRLDEVFIARARERGLLAEPQLASLRSELQARRRREPDLCAHELAVEKGILSIEAALALLDADPEDTLLDVQARIDDPDLVRDTERLTLASLHDDGPDLSPEYAADDEAFDGVPRFVEPLPPAYAIPDSSGDSHLEMELPPPASESGDSLFDDPAAGSTPGLGGFDTEQPALQPADSTLDGTGNHGFVSETSLGMDTAMLSPDDVPEIAAQPEFAAARETLEIQEDDHAGLLDSSIEHSLLDDGYARQVVEDDSLSDAELASFDPGAHAVQTLGGAARPDATAPGFDGDETSPGGIEITSSGDSSVRSTRDTDVPVRPTSPVPAFQNRSSKGATQDFASFEAPHIPPADDDTGSQRIEDESEVISGNMIDSAVNEVMDQADDTYFGPPADLTITPPEVLEDSIAPPRPMKESTLFDSEQIAGADSASRIQREFDADESDFVATTPPSAPGQSRKGTGKPTSRTGEPSVTRPPSFPTEEQSTVYDDSDVSLAEISEARQPTGPASEVTTGSRTQFATGEGGRPGLRSGTDSKLGVESKITGEEPAKPGEQIEANEMTVADLRKQMGIGGGVKVGGETGAMKRLVGGTKRRYAVIREIARGGMGKVIEVEDNDLRRSVALKVLRKEMLDRRDLVERFLEEAQITGQLEHPNIVPVHEIGVDGRGNLYFTMKLVEGEDLSSILKRMRKKDPGAEQAYPLNRMIDIFIKVCEGMAFAHSKGVIHRDLKPANIMVGRFGEVQIMDWGVAKIIGRKEDSAERVVGSDRQDDDAARTMVGSILGTPSYMSPEQARGEVNSMGQESDVFSLGVILYELLALQTPWNAQTSAQVLDQVKNYDPEPPSKKAPDRKIPPELEQLAMKCIEKVPHKRIGSAEELVDNLRSWQEGRTLAAVNYSFGQLFAKWVSRNKVAVITTFLVLLALGGGGFVAYRAAQVATLDRANQSVADGTGLLADARAQLAARNWDTAQNSASDAAIKFQSALDALGDDEVATKGLLDATNVRAEALIRKQTERDEAERTKREEEKRKQLAEALDSARALLATARLQDADAAFEASRVRESFADAGKAFDRVLAVDESNAEAQLARAEIAAWDRNYTTREQAESDLKKLRELVTQGEGKLKAARAFSAENYTDSSKALMETISVLDQAVATPASGEAADRLRARALEMKAEAALEFANRAMASGHYDVSSLMLDAGAATGRKASDFKVARAALEQKVAEQSSLRRLITAAEQAVSDKEWVLAQAHLGDAIAEAANSTFATDEERARLRRMLQLARVEDIRQKEQLARGAEQIGPYLAGYDALIPDLSDPDYSTRARGYREELRIRYSQALVKEADEASDPKARGELLEKALLVVADGAQQSEIRAKLMDIKLQLAQTEVSDRYVLLPRGTFVIGSNRDGDANPQRQFEQQEFLFIDKYLVTNEEFAEFVADGGYTRPELWPTEAQTMLSRFTDSTGQAGPANWVKGGFDASLAKYPVTGISWFEAAAFATWAGKRLATPEEWEIAAGAQKLGESETLGDYPFGTREKAPVAGVTSTREVGTTEWDTSLLGVRDLGCNVSEWTAKVSGNRAMVKGAEPGLGPELFFRYARRAKNSGAILDQRSSGRGFRCVRVFSLDSEKD